MTLRPMAKEAGDGGHGQEVPRRVQHDAPVREPRAVADRLPGTIREGYTRIRRGLHHNRSRTLSYGAPARRSSRRRPPAEERILLHSAHTTPHTTLNLNKKRGALRQKKVPGDRLGAAHQLREGLQAAQRAVDGLGGEGGPREGDRQVVRLG